MKPIAEMTTDEAAFELQRRIAASAPAAVSGSLVDAKNVNQHKCVRLLIDVPVEKAGEVMAAFGWPTMANPIPVAIARLDLSRASGEVSSEASPLSPEEEPGGNGDEPSRRARNWTLANTVAIRCEEPTFWNFLAQCEPSRWSDAGPAKPAEMAARVVRSVCFVETRAEIKPGTEAARRWQDLELRYEQYQRGRAA